MSNPVDITALSGRLQRAVEQLVEADENNPRTRLSESDVKANPYRNPSGNDGFIDHNEGKTLADPFAKSVFEATRYQEGTNVSVGGGSSGFEQTILPTSRVSRGDVNKLASHVELIANRLDTDGDGKLTAGELARVDEEVDAFYAEIYPSHSQPRSQFKERVAGLIRDAFALEQGE